MEGMPTVEFWTGVKWAIGIMVVFGLKELSALLVKKWWFQNGKHERRSEVIKSSEWIERFLDNQEKFTNAMIDLREEMNKILSALQQNGDAIRKFTESAKCKAECKYENATKGRHT